MSEGERPVRPNTPLSPAAHQGLTLFCAAQRIHLTDFLEAIGRGVAKIDQPRGQLRDWVEAARTIEQEKTIARAQHRVQRRSR